MKYIDYFIAGLLMFLGAGCIVMSAIAFDGLLSALAIIGGVLCFSIGALGVKFTKDAYH